MDISDDWLGSLGTYLSGLESHPARCIVDANCIETIENNQATKLLKIEY